MIHLYSDGPEIIETAQRDKTDHPNRQPARQLDHLRKSKRASCLRRHREAQHGNGPVGIATHQSAHGTTQFHSTPRLKHATGRASKEPPPKFRSTLNISSSGASGRPTETASPEISSYTSSAVPTSSPDRMVQRAPWRLEASVSGRMVVTSQTSCSASLTTQKSSTSACE